MSSQVSAGSGGLPSQASSYLSSNFNQLQSLLGVEEPFEYVDVDEEISPSQIGNMRDIGILKVVSHKKSDGDRWRTWRLADAAREYLEAERERHNTAPCGHIGVSNLRDSDQYSCAYDPCDVEFDRETAADIIGGES